MLVVLASILIPVSVISVWAIRTVTSTDQYVETMAPPGAQSRHCGRPGQHGATNALFSTHVVQNKVTDALPKSAKPLVAPIVNEVHSYVYSLALKVFSSPKFGKLWDTCNRHSHQAVINILTGKQTQLQRTSPRAGRSPSTCRPRQQPDLGSNSHGVTLFDPVKSISSQGASFTVVSQQQVSKFCRLSNLIVKFKWVIPVVALVLAILAVALALERRKTLVRLAIGVALMSLLVLGALSAGRGIFIGQAAGGGFHAESAAAVWDTVLRFLKTDLRWTLLISVLVAFGALARRAGPLRRVDPQDVRQRVVAGCRPAHAFRRAPAGPPPSRAVCVAAVAGSWSTSTACASSAWSWRGSSWSSPGTSPGGRCW